MKNLTKAFTRTLPVGRIGIPVWAFGMTILLTAAAAGQAVGPALSGTINGRAAMVIGQSVGLSTGGDAVHRIIGAADSALVVSDDGSGFTAAIEANQGQTVTIELDLINGGEADSNTAIIIEGPVSVRVDADEAVAGIVPALGDPDNINSPVVVAQMNQVTWLAQVTADEDVGDRDIAIQLTGEDSGFFTVRIRLAPIAVGN